MLKIMFSNFLKALTLPLDIFLPSRCSICGRNLFYKNICENCLPELPSPQKRCKICYSPLSDDYNNELCTICRFSKNLPFSEMRFIWNYHGRARRLVSAIKYKPSLALAKIAGELLAETAFSFDLQENYDCIVPIPSSKTNLRIRGFNQAEVLAHYLSIALEIEVDTGILKHKKDNLMPQASLSHEERLKNIRGAFRAEPIQGKKIIIVDDVVTTGATVETAAKILYQAGAAKIGIISLIRSDTWSIYRTRHTLEAA